MLIKNVSIVNFSDLSVKNNVDIFIKGNKIRKIIGSRSIRDSFPKKGTKIITYNVEKEKMM